MRLWTLIADGRVGVGRKVWATGYKTLPLSDQHAYNLFKGVDTSDTPGGYKGRMGLYEVFGVAGAIQELILKREPS